MLRGICSVRVYTWRNSVFDRKTRYFSGKKRQIFGLFRSERNKHSLLSRTIGYCAIFADVIRSYSEIILISKQLGVADLVTCFFRTFCSM